MGRCMSTSWCTGIMCGAMLWAAGWGLRACGRGILTSLRFIRAQSAVVRERETRVGEMGVGGGPEHDHAPPQRQLLLLDMLLLSTAAGLMSGKPLAGCVGVERSQTDSMCVATSATSTRVRPDTHVSASAGSISTSSFVIQAGFLALRLVRCSSARPLSCDMLLSFLLLTRAVRLPAPTAPLLHAAAAGGKAHRQQTQTGHNC